MAKSPKKWVSSDRPYDSYHLECAPTRGARVKPDRNGFEWSMWIGPKGARVLHAQGVVRTKAGAKRAAERACRRPTTAGY